MSPYRVKLNFCEFMIQYVAEFENVAVPSEFCGTVQSFTFTEMDPDLKMRQF